MSILIFRGSPVHDLPFSQVVTLRIKPSFCHFFNLIGYQTHVLCNLIAQYQFQTDLFTVRSWPTQEETYHLIPSDHHKTGIS